MIKIVADNLYQRHYKTWSLYIFAFLYNIRDGTCMIKDVKFFNDVFSFFCSGTLEFLNKYLSSIEQLVVSVSFFCGPKKEKNKNRA